MNKTEDHVTRLVMAGLCLALALVLPRFTGNIPVIGKVLSPMHIPAFICGMVCGWPYGLIVGILSPFLNSAIFHMPPAIWPQAVRYAIEIGTYGLVSGLLFKLLKGTNIWLRAYISLILAMFAGRVIGGAATALIYQFTGSEYSFSIFFASYFTGSLPGIAIHLAIVPPIVFALYKAKLIKE